MNNRIEHTLKVTKTLKELSEIRTRVVVNTVEYDLVNLKFRSRPKSGHFSTGSVVGVSLKFGC